MLPVRRPAFAAICPSIAQISPFVIAHAMTPMRRLAGIIFFRDPRISLILILPILFLSAQIRKERLTMAATDVASANPPCFNGPIRMRERIILTATAMTAALAGVFWAWG